MGRDRGAHGDRTQLRTTDDGRALVRRWRYLGTKVELAHDERADPKIQLAQALAEARTNHARLTERAPIVIAHQKQLQRQLDRLAADHERPTARPARRCGSLTTNHTTAIRRSRPS